MPRHSVRRTTGGRISTYRSASKASIDTSRSNSKSRPSEAWAPSEDEQGEPTSGGQLNLDAEQIKMQIREAISKPKYTVTQFYKKEGLWQRMARSTIFENITLLVICFNAIWIAVDTDYNPGSATLLDAPALFQIADHGFCIFFSFEWFVRFMSFARKRDGLKDGWFMFDGALVSMMVGETWLLSTVLAISGSSSGLPGGSSMLRLIRLLRLSRVVRMLRSFPELMILVKGMASAMKSVMYVMCLLLVFMYVFAIALTQMSIETEMGEEFFYAVHKSMKTLLVSGVFLDNLSTVADAIRAESSFCLFLWFAFILLGNLTVMNMLIGVLCEVVSAVAKTEKEEMQVEFVTTKLKLILEEVDEDCDHKISKQEFRKILAKPLAARALLDVGVDPVGIVDYTDYIFDDLLGGKEKDAEITFEQFMSVVLRLRGNNVATVKDCIDVRKFIVQTLEKMDEKVQKSLEGQRRKSLSSISCDESASSIKRRPDSPGSPASPFVSEVALPNRSLGHRFVADAPPLLLGTPQDTGSGDFDIDPSEGEAIRNALDVHKARTARLETGLSDVLLELRRLRDFLPERGLHGAQDDMDDALDDCNSPKYEVPQVAPLELSKQRVGIQPAGTSHLW